MHQRRTRSKIQNPVPVQIALQVASYGLLESSYRAESGVENQLG